MQPPANVFLFLAFPPQKYPHLVIPTGGPVDRKLSLCHLDRSGEI